MSAGGHIVPSAAAGEHRVGALRAAALAVLALAGVAASALLFSWLWPKDPAAAAPQRLSPAQSAAARALVERARTLVSVSPEQLGYRLRIAGPLHDVRGRTDTAARTITLFVSPDDAAHRVAHDLGHEVGHAFDAERLDAADRSAYMRTRGVARGAWWPDPEVNDYRSGAGDFAEVFALCHSASPEFRSRLAPRPDDPCHALPVSARTAKLGGGVR